MLACPWRAFGSVTHMPHPRMTSWRRTREGLETQPAIADEPTAPSKPEPQSIRGAIEFRDLTFSYGDGARVLQHVSAAIEAGQTAALVGPTGSGKSTLISLLARLHDPPAGTVFIDGIDVREIPLATLRGAIGFVPQEAFLFSDTLADNVAFGLDANDHARATLSGLPEAGLKGSPYERDRADRI